jgi:hypothetical protein
MKRHANFLDWMNQNNLGCVRELTARIVKPSFTSGERRHSHHDCLVVRSGHKGIVLRGLPTRLVLGNSDETVHVTTEATASASVVTEGFGRPT